jgi:hypothetical protein
MHSKELKYLPIDILQIIYKMYYPWVLRELLEKWPENNSFIVRDSHSKTPITEIDIPLGYLYIYRSGISNQPSEIPKQIHNNNNTNNQRIKIIISREQQK